MRTCPCVMLEKRSQKQRDFCPGGKTIQLKWQGRQFQDSTHSTGAALMLQLTVNHILALGVSDSLKCPACALTSERRRSFLTAAAKILSLEGEWGTIRAPIRHFFVNQVIKTSDLMKVVRKSAIPYIYFKFTTFGGAKGQHLHLQREISHRCV